ncbi:hypothetical protein [Lysinibacillus xylanilyticus]
MKKLLLATALLFVTIFFTAESQPKNNIQVTKLIKTIEDPPDYRKLV